MHYTSAPAVTADTVRNGTARLEPAQRRLFSLKRNGWRVGSIFPKRIVVWLLQYNGEWVRIVPNVLFLWQNDGSDATANVEARLCAAWRAAFYAGDYYGLVNWCTVEWSIKMRQPPAAKLVCYFLLHRHSNIDLVKHFYWSRFSQTGSIYWINIVLLLKEVLIFYREYLSKLPYFFKFRQSVIFSIHEHHSFERCVKIWKRIARFRSDQNNGLQSSPGSRCLINCLKNLCSLLGSSRCKQLPT